MTVKESIFEIALASLYETNQMLFDYWVTELCENDELVESKLTDENLRLIQIDVMQQVQA